ncbi:MAG TPA: serine--tRNA ligase, partial [Bacteroidia bacterium]|nr:serine--tRNA ligase [Bacteroidia bacterium]
MLQISVLREKPEYVISRLAVKNFDAKELVARILSMDEDRRKIQNELDGLLNQQNTLAKQVGDLYKSGKKAEADDLKNKSAALKASSQELNDKLNLAEQQLHQELVKLPNMPSELVPAGKTPEDN